MDKLFRYFYKLIMRNKKILWYISKSGDLFIDKGKGLKLLITKNGDVYFQEEREFKSK